MAAVAAALVVAAFLGETLFDSKKVLGGLDHTLASPPWSDLADGSPPLNPELSDPTVVFDPFLHFLRREVKEGGGLPLWNPHQFSGSPAAGNPQFGHFSPVRWLAHAMPVERSFAFQAAAKLLAALLFTFLLARRIGLSRGAAAFASLGFGLGGYQILWLLYPLSDVSVLAPAVFLGLESYFATGSRRALAGTAAAFGIAVLGGHPETAFFLGLFAGMHSLAHGFARGRAAGTRAGVVAAALPLTALLLGAALAAVSLVPAIEYMRESAARTLRSAHLHRLDTGRVVTALLVIPAVFVLIRRFRPRLRDAVSWRPALVAGGAIGVAVALAFSLILRREGVDRLAHALFPDLHGNPVFSPPYEGRTAYLQAAGPYAGLASIVLGVLSLFVAPRRLSRWKGTAIAAFVLLAQPAILAPVLSVVPGLALAEPSRVAPLANLATALLAGLGLDAIVTRFRQTRVVVGGSLFGGALAATAIALIPSGALSGPASSPAPAATDSPRAVVFTEPQDGDAIRGGRVPFAGIVSGTGNGDRLEIELDRGDGFGARVAATLGPSMGDDSRTTPRLFSGVFEPLVLPEGRYRLVARIVDSSGQLLDAFDGGVLTARFAGSVPGRSIALGAATLALLAILLSGKLAASVGRLLAIVLVGIDLWLFGHGFNPAGPIERVYPPTELEAFLRLDPDLHGPKRRGRIWTEGGVFPPDTATRIGLLDTRGYDAIDLGRYDLFLLALARDPNLFAGRWTLRDLRADLPAFDLLAVKFAVTPHAYDDPRWSLVRDGPIRVYRNLDFRGLAILSPGIQWESEVSSVEQVDPSRAALLDEGDVGGRGSVAIVKAFTEGEARIEEHHPDRVVVSARLDGEGILTLCENWFPGWEVEVDGKAAPLLRTFTTFRGVRLGEGDHRVVFAYRPKSVRWGLGLTIAAGVAVFAMAAFGRRSGAAASTPQSS